VTTRDKTILASYITLAIGAVVLPWPLQVVSGVLAVGVYAVGMLGGRR